MNTDSNETLDQGGAGQSAPVADTTSNQPARPAPRNDAEAAQQEAEAQAAAAQQPNDAQAQAQAQAEAQQAERQKNRTKEYIGRLQSDNATLRQQLAELSANRGQPSQPRPTAAPSQGGNDDPEPTYEGCDYDPVAYAQAYTQWHARQASKEQRESQARTAAREEHQRVVLGYQQKAHAFAEAHPDYWDVVNQMPPDLLPSDVVQRAIMAHERGPEIVYHLANNDDDAFALASVQPHLAARAVERIAQRLSAAPPAPSASQQATPPAAPAAAAPKPISRAPAPAPTVSGRSPTETPPEKMTDDQWYAADRERRRKR